MIVKGACPGSDARQNGALSDVDGPVVPAPPSDHIELPDGIVLARIRADHAAAVTVAINESLDHLSPWMAWADKPAEESQRAVFMATAEELWEKRRDFTYTIFDATGRVIGGCGLHGRQGPDALDIGYWVHVDHIGRGLATAASRALTTAAFAIDGIERVRIQCEDANAPSARIPDKLGYVFQGVDVPEAGTCAGRPTQDWQMSRERWMTLAAEVPS